MAVVKLKQKAGCNTVELQGLRSGAKRGIEDDAEWNAVAHSSELATGAEIEPADSQDEYMKPSRGRRFGSIEQELVVGSERDEVNDASHGADGKRRNVEESFSVESDSRVAEGAHDDTSSWQLVPSDLLEEDEPLGSTELKEPWEWEKNRRVLENAGVSARSPAGHNLVEILHNLALRLQTELFKREPLAPAPWYTPRWLGIDTNFWLCTLGYQGAVLALLIAAVEIANHLFNKEREVTGLITQSFLRQCKPLEAEIHKALGKKGGDLERWFRERATGEAVAELEVLLDKDPFFQVSNGGDKHSDDAKRVNDADVVTMALHVQGAISHLGPEAVACPGFSSLASDETKEHFSLLAQLLPIDVVFTRTSLAGLRKEFLSAFRERAAIREEVATRGIRKKRRCGDEDEEERAFWVQTIEALLQSAIVQEGVFADWRGANVNHEALKADLAVFGFFTALGRATRTYLAVKGEANTDEAVATFLRYLEGACVLFYPELTNLLRYQLFVDVICEELGWLPFYPGITVTNVEVAGKKKRVSKRERRMAIITAERTCASWLRAFARHSRWLKAKPDSMAGRLIKDSRRRLGDCVRAHESKPSTQPQENAEQGLRNMEGRENTVELMEVEDGLWQEKRWEQRRKAMLGRVEKRKAVEEKVLKLEKEVMAVKGIMQHLDNLIVTGSGGQQRKLTLSGDLQRLQQLHDQVREVNGAVREDVTKEEENLRVACEVKEVLREGGGVGRRRDRSVLKVRRFKSFGSHGSEVDAHLPSSSSTGSNSVQGGQSSFQRLRRDESVSQSRKFWQVRWGSGRFRSSARTRSRREWEALLQQEEGEEQEDGRDAEVLEGVQEVEEMVNGVKGVLGEMAARLQREAPEAIAKLPLGKVLTVIAQRAGEGPKDAVERAGGDSELSEWLEMVELPQRKGGFLSKSVEALKESSADAWRGTQLLSTDVVAALAMLQRWAAGQRLTLRQTKILKRTFVDVAAVIPIGILMLLPLTPVGHGAILHIIQKWFPGMIPSSFSADRLDVARQLEQVRALALEPMHAESHDVETALDEAAADAKHSGSSSDEEEEDENVSSSTGIQNVK